MEKILGLVDNQPVYVTPSGRVAGKAYSANYFPFHLLQNLQANSGKIVIPKAGHRTLARSFVIASVQKLEPWQNVLVIKSPNAFSRTCVKEIHTYLKECNGSLDERTRNELGAIAESMR